MEYTSKNTNRHKMMAMGMPIKAAKGGSITKAKKMASGGDATKDRQGRALLPGKMAKNLPMIAPQRAYAKGGDVKASAYDKRQDARLQEHENEPMGVAHKAVKKAKGGIMEKSSGERYASKAAMMKHEAKETPAMEKAEHKKHGGSMKRKFG